MTVPILLISDDKQAAEQFIAKYASQKLNFSFSHELDYIYGAVIVSTGKHLVYLRREYQRLFAQLRKFPVALVVINYEKALKIDSYEFVDISDFVYPVVSQMAYIGFSEGSGQRKTKVCAESEFISYLEQNCDSFMTAAPERFGREESKVVKEFQKHGKWGWLPRQ